MRHIVSGGRPPDDSSENRRLPGEHADTPHPLGISSREVGRLTQTLLVAPVGPCPSSLL